VAEIILYFAFNAKLRS